MAKIEFSEQEIGILKAVAHEYHEHGKESAKYLFESSGMDLEISDSIMESSVPEMDNGSDGCYACIVCLFILIVAMVEACGNCKYVDGCKGCFSKPLLLMNLNYQ